MVKNWKLWILTKIVWRICEKLQKNIRLRAKTFSGNDFGIYFRKVVYMKYIGNMVSDEHLYLLICFVCTISILCWSIRNSGYRLCLFLRFDIWFWNSSDRVVFFVLLHSLTAWLHLIIYIYIFIMKLPLYIGGANRRGVGGASNYSY